MKSEEDIKQTSSEAPTNEVDVRQRHCLDDSPLIDWIRLDYVDSTNNYLRRTHPDSVKKVTLVTAEFQTAGRGSATNRWESEEGKNITMSLLVHPTHIQPLRQYQLTEVLALAVRDALNTYREGFTIKWPNDIYFGNKKVVGMLTENLLTGTCIKDSVMGVGINVNQTTFISDAPNPSSLSLITNQTHSRKEVLSRIMDTFLKYYGWTEEHRDAELHQVYLSHLYRLGVMADFEDKDRRFTACIETVEPDGHLVLKDTEGQVRKYEFKEVKFIIKE